RRRGRRPAHEERRRNESRPHEHRDDELRGPPVHLRDEPCRERRHGHRRYADADRDQRHREAAVLTDPAHDGGDHRREETADGDAGHEGAERHHHPSVTWLFHDVFSAAAFSAAISIFFILSIASMTRFAFLASGLASSWPRMAGFTCHDRPYLSLSQPHIDSCPP